MSFRFSVPLALFLIFFGLGSGISGGDHAYLMVFGGVLWVRLTEMRDSHARLCRHEERMEEIDRAYAHNDVARAQAIWRAEILYVDQTLYDVDL